MSWNIPTLRELRGRFTQERVSFDLVAKVAKTLRRLQVQVSNLDDSWGLSAFDLDNPIPLREVVILVDDGVSVGIHPRYFTAFCSLD